MSKRESIKAGDKVTSNGRYPNLESEYFKYGPLEVVRVEENTLEYTGYGFVFVAYNGKPTGLYLNGLKKI